MNQNIVQLTRDDSGPVVWRALQEIDGREWVTTATLPKSLTEVEAGPILLREFDRGHKWLKNGVADVKPLPEKVKLVANAFTYSRQIGADLFSWCCGIEKALANHPRVESVHISYSCGYPTDRVRNGALHDARAHGLDFLLMLDEDQAPDIGPPYGAIRPDIVPFLPSALDFVLAHDGPCIIGAPYCGSPPLQEVLVMKNREYVPGLRDGMGLKVDKYTRDEAAIMTGIQRVAALPTGCLLVDLRVLDVLPPPWFSYEYSDPPFNSALASTEDIVFTRNLDWLGVRQYCHWSAWAGHNKHFTTGIPAASPVENIPQNIRRAWDNGWRPLRERV